MRFNQFSIRAAAGLALLLASTAAIAQAPPGAGGPGGPGPLPGGFSPPPVDHSFDDLTPPADGKGLGGYAFGVDQPLPPNSPQPSSDPHNFEGAWIHAESLVFLIDKDSYGMRPPYNKRAHHLLAARLKALGQAKPYLNASSTCRPPGLPWQQDLNMPFAFFQSKNRIDVLYEEYHGLQTIYMNPADAPKTPSYMGTSIGHWDGDTLVVVTKGMKQALWLDVNGTPASKDAVITQRIRKVFLSRWTLEIQTSIDDPTYYTRPWSWTHSYAWTPEQQIFKEYDCETQVGDKTSNANAGLLPEPASDDQP